MNKKQKKFNLINKKTAIVAGILGFGLIAPQSASANFLTKIFIGEAANIARASLVFLVDSTFWVLHWFVKAGAIVFNAMLNMGFTSQIHIVKAGWEVSRDVANTVFILFLVIIAFATILRLERYGIKQLLPKVIIIALLINFSYIICAVIIDISNITASVFANQIQEYTGHGGASGRFVDSLNLVSTFSPVQAGCSELSSSATVPIQFWGADGMGPPETIMKSPRALCLEAETESAINTSKEIASAFITFIITASVGSIVLLIAAFTLFAGGIMLLIRIVMLWFLLMFVPLIFLCYIMPNLRSLWQKWWSTFLRWCFFAPAYAFFIWLAMKVSIEGQTKQIAEQASQSFNKESALGTVFTSDPGGSLIHLLFIIALLLGGIVAASKFGIYGAGATMKIVQRTGKNVRGWTGRQAMKPARGLAAGALKRIGESKLFKGDETKTGIRMKALSTQMKRKPEQDPKYKRLDASLQTTSDEGVLTTMRKDKGKLGGFIATKHAVRRSKLVRSMNKEDATIVVDNLRAFGEGEAADKFEEIRGDSIKNKNKQRDVAQKIVQEGNLGKVPPVVLEDENFVAAVAEFASAAQLMSLAKQSPEHAEALKETLKNFVAHGNTTMASIKDPEIQNKIHHTYASQSGDITQMSKPQREKWAQTAGPSGIKNMNMFDADVAKNIPLNQLSKILQEMKKSEVASDIAEWIRTDISNPKRKHFANNDPYLKNL